MTRVKSFPPGYIELLQIFVLIEFVKKKPDYYLDAEVAGTDGLNMYSQIAADQALPERRTRASRIARIHSVGNIKAT